MQNFFYPQSKSLIDSFNNKIFEEFKFRFSEEFLKIGERKLLNFFLQHYKLKVDSRLICFSGLSDSTVFYSTEYSYYKTSMYVNHNFPSVDVIWFSKSGRIYRTDDTDIDENDIEFAINGLEIDDLYKMLYPKTKLPFTTKKFSFEVEVVRLNINMDIVLHGSTQGAIEAADFFNKFNVFMGSFDDRDNPLGNVHNHRFTKENDIVTISLDMGSSGFAMLKKILSYLSKTHLFTKVVIE